MKVCLLSETFPPLVDGVANTVRNYAEIIRKKHGDTMVSVIGENALNTLYFSWEDAVKKAVERYKLVIKNYHQ